MAYTPNTWATGDTITAQKLNNMEQGIANSGALVVNLAWIPDDEFGNSTLDKTWQEIHDAVLSGGVTIVQREIYEGQELISVPMLQSVQYNSDQEYAYLVVASEIEYSTATANGYPQTHWTD